MSIAALRQQLAEIVEGGRPAMPGLATGMAALDAVLPGHGLPRGRLTEITGAPGSGRTTIARQLVAATLQAGWWVAYVDAARTLAPRDWAALGAHDGLWVVRPDDPARGAWCADVLLRSGAFGLVVLDGAPALSRPVAVRLVRLARASDAAFVLLAPDGQHAGVAGALQLRVQRVRAKRKTEPLDLTARLEGRPALVLGSAPVLGSVLESVLVPRLVLIPAPRRDLNRAACSSRSKKAVPHSGWRWNVPATKCVTPRVACVRIPRFPIGAVWLDAMSPDAACAPEALVNGASAAAPPLHWDEQLLALRDGQRLRAVTAAAARLHVRAGMTVAAARGRCATLEVRDWDDACVTRELARTSAAFLSASPQVAPAAGMPGTWWIGATGFDGLGGEHALVEVLQRMARVWSPSARVCVADSCVAARAGTWETADGGRRTADGGRQTADGGCIVPPGGDATYLAPLPLTLIPMDPEVREALVALGLGTCGALAALSSGDVERRWGAAGLSAWRLAQGIDPRRPVLTPIGATRQAHAELALSTTNAEPVLFLVRGALERLMADLVRDGRAAAAVAITLTLDDGRGALPSGGMPHTITREVRAPRALARVSPWFERCRALLDSWTLTAPVSAVTVAITTVAPLSAEQGDLLAPAWRDPAAAEAAFERLRSTLGADSVVRAVACDAYCPERQGVWRGVETADGGRPMADGKDESTVPVLSAVRRLPSAVSLRLLESPEPISIIASPQGEPRALHWRGRRIPIARARGPERLSGAWWTEAPFARDYWRCESDELEQEFLLYRDRVGWKLQGWYD